MSNKNGFITSQAEFHQPINQNYDGIDYIERCETSTTINSALSFKLKWKGLLRAILIGYVVKTDISLELGTVELG